MHKTQESSKLIAKTMCCFNREKEIRDMSKGHGKKLAIVTGGSSGIGLALAKELLRENYRVVLVGRSEEKLKNAIRQLAGEKRGRVAGFPCDLSQESECLRLREVFREKPVRVLINCAGFGVYGSFGRTDSKAEMDMLAVNCRAVHLLMKWFIEDMERRGEGSVLNVASSAGLTPGGPYMAAYYASKSYVVSLTRGVAEELRAAKSPVYVGVLCPGPVDTPFFDRAGIGAAVKGSVPEKVALAAIRGMKRRQTVITPGLANKAACAAAKFLPAAPVLSVNRKIQARKGKGAEK